MKKIPSLFVRDFAEGADRSLVTRALNPEAEWVASGLGLATRKWDGTAMMLRGSEWFCRYDVKTKNGFDRKAPDGFEPCQDPDPNTGHWPGWLPVLDGNPGNRFSFYKFFVEARAAGYGAPAIPFPDGTYELCGPRLQGNPERLSSHVLFRHGEHVLQSPRDFDGLTEWFKSHDVEGIVFWHPDGRMVKIKARDFGIKRGAVLSEKVVAPLRSQAE